MQAGQKREIVGCELCLILLKNRSQRRLGPSAGHVEECFSIVLVLGFRCPADTILQRIADPRRLFSLHAPEITDRSASGLSVTGASLQIWTEPRDSLSAWDRLKRWRFPGLSHRERAIVRVRVREYVRRLCRLVVHLLREDFYSSPSRTTIPLCLSSRFSEFHCRSQSTASTSKWV
jgi:hypothetical protein